MDHVSPRQDEVWTPEGVAQGLVYQLPDRDDGTHIEEWTFKVEYRGRTAGMNVVTDSQTSRAHIEDMVCAAFERFRIQVDEILDREKPRPSLDQRKDIGATIREIKHYSRKREGLTKGLYKQGVSVG